MPCVTQPPIHIFELQDIVLDVTVIFQIMEKNFCMYRGGSVGVVVGSVLRHGSMAHCKLTSALAPAISPTLGLYQEFIFPRNTEHLFLMEEST